MIYPDFGMSLPLRTEWLAYKKARREKKNAVV